MTEKPDHKMSPKKCLLHKIEIARVNASEGREEWLAIRRQHITATDWPMITGSSRWGTASDVLADKLDTDYSGCSEPSEIMQLGNDLEPLIIKKLMKMFGPGEYVSQVFLSRKRLGFTPDLLLIKKGSAYALAEIKVSLRRWRGILPREYRDQAEFQATVLGIDRIDVFHLQLETLEDGRRMRDLGIVPANRLASYPVLLDSRKRRHIERQAMQWWNAHVVKGEPV